jgi:diadenosine tetraphosphatase ApaH/serine/threonine PP2A family protein phosphatase
MQTPPHHASVYVIGDIHGQLKKLQYLLHHAGLVTKDLHWAAGSAVLWFVGDFVDRGPDGIAVIDLVMRLQAEAAQAGGKVASVLGNHEMLLLGAYRFGRRSTGLGSNFITRWKQNGGNRKDIAGLTHQHLEWLASLPLIAHVDDDLLVHADAPFYVKYGRSVEEINATIGKLLHRSDALAWEELLEEFARRGAFSHELAGTEFARRFLALFGGQRIIHGHTPIHFIKGGHPRHITEPYVYANDLCVNVDGGMALGGPGFIYRLS